MVLSFETFFNGRVEKQRQAQRDSWLLFFLFYCCGLAFVSFEHVRFMFNIFWAPFWCFEAQSFMLRGRLSVFLAYQATNKIDPLYLC